MAVFSTAVASIADGSHAPAKVADERDVVTSFERECLRCGCDCCKMAPTRRAISAPEHLAKQRREGRRT
jgi:hypothetical protein